MYYYAHHLGGNRNVKEKNIKGTSIIKIQLIFCENWDQKSFDPNFKSLPVEQF